MPARLGHCPACGRPYTAGEVQGLGILRPRPARSGGPLVEFACPGCDRTLTLVPHGQGRYAPPGEPPPPPVPPEARRPPWVDAGAGEGARDAGGGPAAEEAEAPEPPPPPREPPRPRRRARREPPPPPPSAAPADGPVTPSEALELLGVGPGASRGEIERAYRQRSLACHPDKVAHLDADFQALADRKFRRLREAYELLRG